MSVASLSVSVEFHRRREFGHLGHLTIQEEGFLLAETIKKGSCGFFSWYDPQMSARSKAIIPGLLRGRNQLESEYHQWWRLQHEQDRGRNNDIGEVSRYVRNVSRGKGKGHAIVGNEIEMQLMTFNNDIEQGSERSAFRPPRSIKPPRPPSNLQSAIEETEAEDQVETIIETQLRTEVGVYPPPLPTMVGPTMYQQLQSSVPSLQRTSRVQIRAPPPMVGYEFFSTRITTTQASSSSSVPVVVDQGKKYVAISDLGPEMSQPNQSAKINHLNPATQLNQARQPTSRRGRVEYL
ncbi:hypothetical protein BUALT_Bualt02G0056300 [Buddleja alternifolia]|uniref:Uncharacterized protein n=1 Tax=Buddleja alternifolia TaxID=168488 RepID=A0AAV6Y8L3_9LAMI|nr:hypothetical protein BUALT_Bualt02G0056300 [Buddleja alternifolia]